MRSGTSIEDNEVLTWCLRLGREAEHRGTVEVTTRDPFARRQLDEKSILGMRDPHGRTEQLERRVGAKHPWNRRIDGELYCRVRRGL